MSVKSSSLYYRDGGSDKVYHAQIEPKDGGFVVNFQYGRRGSTLTSGTKTASPVPLDQAEKVYDKLIKEKTAKGYSPGEDGTPFQGTDKAGEVSGLVPQLLNPIELEQVIALISDDDWFMQEKEDGKHQMAKIEGDQVIGSNRKGLIIPLAQTIEVGLKQLDGGYALAIVDGEALGDRYALFDLLQLNTQDIRTYGAWFRFIRLRELFDQTQPANLKLVRTASTTAEKQALFDLIKAERGEGVVFKRKNAPYIPGRPNSGGNMLKFKFKGSATCQVIQQNGTKRSVEVGVGAVDGTAWIQTIGNVTIPANYEIPKAGDLVEVEYLYAYPGGSLYQPIYKGPRPDKDTPDQYTSLKFKQGTEEEES